jgi:hypothetical protein
MGAGGSVSGTELELLGVLAGEGSCGSPERRFCASESVACAATGRSSTRTGAAGATLGWSCGSVSIGGAGNRLFVLTARAGSDVRWRVARTTANTTPAARSVQIAQL